MMRSSSSTPSSPEWWRSSLHLQSRAQPSYRGSYFQPIDSRITLFQSWYRHPDHRWGMENRWTGKLRALTFSSSLSSQQTGEMPHYCWQSPDPLVHLPSLMSRLRGTWTLPTESHNLLAQREPSTCFQLKTLASDLDMLTLSSDTSRWIVNLLRLWYKDAKRTTSSAKTEINLEVLKLHTLKYTLKPYPYIQKTGSETRDGPKRVLILNFCQGHELST